MEVRRFTLTVPDERGRPQRGEVLLADRWQPELAESGPQPGDRFRIVLLSQPAPSSARVSSPNVAVLAPSQPIQRQTRVSEPPVMYAARPGAAPPFPSLSPADMASYAEGRILTARSPRVSIRRLFPLKENSPRLELLARTLLRPVEEEGETAERNRFLLALASALAAPAKSEAEAWDAERALAALRNLLRQAESKTAEITRGALAGTVDGLRTVAAAEAGEEAFDQAERHFEEPASFSEAVFALRCLTREPDRTAELAEMRAYLAAMVVPESASDLAMDRRVTLEQLTYAALFMEPHSFEGMRATFEYLRKRFIAAYREHHRHYWESCGRVARELEERESTARALIRLNSISELGKPVGLNGLARFQEMRRTLAGCPLDEALAESLKEAPACPMCSTTLADEPPEAAAREVLRRLERALQEQQNRLSGVAIRSILAWHKGEKIEQFLQVVQASDLRGLAEVLDDELVAFLRELLGAATLPASSVLERLSRLHPEVSPASLEAAVGEFRRLLAEELAAQSSANPARPPRVVLATAASSKARK
ncbi:MAG: hypothetical protein ABSG55_06925 [Dehalococcoidia bacterium]|jgi:hypothetical protein